MDPTNSAWSKDTDKFGYKMMEKMGWQDGKGLGVNLTGSTSHVKVTRKRDALGIGAAKDNDFNWLATQDVYSTLLAGLNESHNAGKILEEAPESSEPTHSKAIMSRRAAMFYGRFKKSKGMASDGATETDMACIVGGKDRRPKRHQGEDKEAVADETAEHSVNKDGSLVTLTSKESMGDYFARMIAAKAAKANVIVGNATKILKDAEATAAEEVGSEDEDLRRRHKREKKERKKKEAEVTALAEEVNSEDEDLCRSRKREKKEMKRGEAEVLEATTAVSSS